MVSISNAACAMNSMLEMGRGDQLPPVATIEGLVLLFSEILEDRRPRLTISEIRPCYIAIDHP